MRRLFFTAMCVLAAAAGCRQCASPYDYCSPVVENGPMPGPGPGYPDGGPDYAANHGGSNSQTAGANSGMRTAAMPQSNTQQ